MLAKLKIEHLCPVQSLCKLKTVRIVILWPTKLLACFCSKISIYLYVILVFVGESTLDFLFDFVEMSQGLVQAFAALETRPRSGNVNC